MIQDKCILLDEVICECFLHLFLQFVPASLGFGSQGKLLRPTEHVPEKQGSVPPDADLEYELELVRVSVPPT